LYQTGGKYGRPFTVHTPRRPQVRQAFPTVFGHRRFRPGDRGEGTPVPYIYTLPDDRLPSHTGPHGRQVWLVWGFTVTVAAGLAVAAALGP
jgi:hypothetical protein